MIHKLKLQTQYFDSIASGEKLYEIRLNDEKRQKIEVGDLIEFAKQPDLSESLVCVVKDLVYFDSFAELVDTIPLYKMGFKYLTKNEVTEIFRKFYSVEDEKKYGVVAIKVEKNQ